MKNNIGIYNPLLMSHWLCDPACEKVKEIWSDVNTLQGWLDTEVALAQAQAELGMIPKEAAIVIQQKADATLFDMDKISEDIKTSMHPLMPALHQFEDFCGEAGSYIHWGATTQNILDGGAVLQLRATHELIIKGLDQILEKLAVLAEKTKDTPMTGRTHGQHALPITFGFKVAAWHEEISRQYDRLVQATKDCFEIRIGGAVGSFAAMEGKGRAIQEKMAQILNLSSPSVPVRTSGDSMAAYVTQLALLGATFEKIGREVVFLQRNEIAEVEEVFYYGKIGSSTMPQKRNPQRAMNVVSTAQLLRSQMVPAGMTIVRMNEGHSSQELILYMFLAEASILATTMVYNALTLVSSLQVNEQKMLDNLNLTGGLILSESVMIELARHIGRPAAHHAVYNATVNCVDNNITFKEALLDELSTWDLPEALNLDELLVPESYLGECADCVMHQLNSK